MVTGYDGGYSIWLELLALESVEGSVIDPEYDVPFAALWETQETLSRLAAQYTSGGDDT